MEQADGRNRARVDRIVAALRSAALDAIVCALPTNVLLLTGYWPVVGTAVAIVTIDGRVVAIAPPDELDVAGRGWADEVIPYAPAPLGAPARATATVREPLQQAAEVLGIARARVGYERGPTSEPASYVEMFLYGGALADVLGEACPSARFVPADAMLAELRCTPTAFEIGRIRSACGIAARALDAGARRLGVGMNEHQGAAPFQSGLCTADGEATRVGGFAFCMSGPNAARAYAAYQRTSQRELQRGDLVLIHCNSYADGYWTDITRTFCLGTPDDLSRAMYDAIFSARDAALACIRPGERAGEIDRAARAVIEARGFGAAFKHATGHGVGFAAIDHDAPPRLAPNSNDRLAEGMVFNVEPGLYLDDYGGARHCDMVVVTAGGAELLTPFLSRMDEVVLSRPEAGGTST